MAYFNQSIINALQKLDLQRCRLRLEIQQEKEQKEKEE